MMLAFTDLKFRRGPILSALMVMLSVILLPLKDSSGSKVNGQQQQDFSNTQIQYSSNSPTSKGSLSTNSPTPLSSNQLTTYILQKLLGASNAKSTAAEEILNSATVSGTKLVYDQAQRRAAEERIFSDGSGASIVYGQPAAQPKAHEIPIRRYLDEAKEQIDVIDFTQPVQLSDHKYARYVRKPRQNTARIADDLQFSDNEYVASSSNRRAATGGGGSTRESRGSASEQVPIRLAFPGNEYKTSRRYERSSPSGCTNCVDDSTGRSGNRWTMPLQRLGDKQYYLGIFFKANWYKAEQYCRFHGMHLASINSADEQKDLQEHIQAYGMGHEHFWTSGTDQGEEGKFFWMANGKPVTFENWNAGEPNNFVYEDGEEEHCLEMWDRDGKGLKWNDTPCSFSTFFICEA